MHSWLLSRENRLFLRHLINPPLQWFTIFYVSSLLLQGSLQDPSSVVKYALCASSTKKGIPQGLLFSCDLFFFKYIVFNFNYNYYIQLLKAFISVHSVQGWNHGQSGAVREERLGYQPHLCREAHAGSSQVMIISVYDQYSYFH